MIPSTPPHEPLTWRTFDPLLCRAASRWASRRGIHCFFGVISRLGDGWFWYGLIAVIAISGGGRGRLVVLQMLGTGFVAWLLYRGLKRRTRRPRPFHTHADVIARAVALDEYSFPSGHTLHAVSFSIVAIWWFPFLALPLIVFSTLVAMSRVLLGLHYPTDVLAGLLLGGVLGAASLWTGSTLFPAMA